MVTECIENKNSENTNINGKWSFIKESIHTAARETLGITQPKVRNNWFDEDCKKVIEIRNSCRMNMLLKRTRTANEEYRKARKEAKYVCRIKKKNHQEAMLYDLQDKFGRNDSKKFFEGIRNLKRGFQARTNICKDKDGNLVGGEQQVLMSWLNYFKDILCNDDDTSEPRNIYFGPEPNIAEPTPNMIYDVIKKLKNNRAPGEDSITAELIKHGGKNLWKCRRVGLYDLTIDIWNTEIMPTEWNIAILCPIHKKGNKLECNNYRGISLLNVTYKIFTNILASYIQPYTDQILGGYQCGFRKKSYIYIKANFRKN